MKVDRRLQLGIVREFDLMANCLDGEGARRRARWAHLPLRSRARWV
jgi:hypothetical protein